MIPASKIAASARAAALVGLCALGCPGGVAAQEPARSARSGALAKAGGYQFEVFFYPTGLRVFPTDSTGAAVDVSKLSGTATFYHPNSPAPWFSRPLPAASGPGATSLDLPINLGTVPPTGAKAEFKVAGLPGAAGSPATFTVPVAFVGAPDGGASTRPSAAPGAAAAEPKFEYGLGAAGVGYYTLAGPRTAPSRASTSTTRTASARTGSATRSSRSTSGTGTRSTTSGSGGRGFRDWSTGRNRLRLAKPWLTPRD